MDKAMSKEIKRKKFNVIHYSWVVVLITFLTLMVSAGIRSTPGVLLVPFQDYFGWNRAIISSAVAINLLLYGLCGPFSATLTELYGSRKVMSLALLVLSIGSCLSAWMKTPWQMTLLWGIVIGVGTGFLSPVLGTVVSNLWFVKRKGLVIGIFSAGGATGQLIFLPLFSKLVEVYDWRIVVWLISITALLVMLLVIILIRNNPGDIGLLPYGAQGQETPLANKSNIKPLMLAFKGLKTAIHSREFWLLSGSFFVCGATTNGLIGTHFIPACMDHGISAIVAAGMLSMAGIFNIIGTTVSGWLSDKFDNRWLLFWYYILRSVSLILLPFTLNMGLLSILIFIVFYGLDWIATVPPTVRLTGDIFGSQNGIIFGWMMAIHQVGAAIAAFLSGALHTYIGSYQIAFISGGLICLIASGLVIKVNKVNHNVKNKINTINGDIQN